MDMKLHLHVPGIQKSLIVWLIVVCCLYMVCVMNTVNRIDSNELQYRASKNHGKSLIPPPKPLNGHTESPNEINLSTLTSTDYSTLINLTDFKFILNSQRCQRTLESNEQNSLEPRLESNIFLAIFVHSAPAHLDKRNLIRSTWGNESLFNGTAKIRLVFMLGSVGKEWLQEAIEQEQDLHGDLVQGNFEDSYRNLTYKHVMGLKWITYHCAQAKFVLKTDDDIFVDMFQLVYYLKGQLSVGQSKNIISCYVISNPYPRRSTRSKWRVSFQEYPQQYYPRYCSGWGIVMSPDVVFRLYNVSRQLPFFWVDDVYVTGLLAERLHLQHNDFNMKLAIGWDEIERWLQDNQTLSVPPLFGHPDSSSETISAMWTKTIKYYKDLVARKDDY